MDDLTLIALPAAIFAKDRRSACSMTLVWIVRHCSVLKDCGLHAICTAAVDGGPCASVRCEREAQLLAGSRHPALRACVSAKQCFVRGVVDLVGEVVIEVATAFGVRNSVFVFQTTETLHAMSCRAAIIAQDHALPTSYPRSRPRCSHGCRQ